MRIRAIVPPLVIAVVLSLLVSVGLGRESERLRLAYAKTLAGIASQPELPNAPPNIKLNIPGANVRPGAGMSLEVSGEPFQMTEADQTVLPLPELWLVVRSNCPPCEAAKTALAETKLTLPFRVVIKTQCPFLISSYPTFLWHPTSGSPADNPKTAVQLRGWHGLAETIRIFEQSRKAGGHRRLTAEELKGLVSNWSGPEVGIVGMTPRQHLMDERHGFTADQLAGLSDRELRLLHSANHAGDVMPMSSERTSPPPSASGATDASRVTGATGAAGVLHGRSQIEALLGWWRSNLGDSAVAKVEWTRNGSQKLPLLRLTAWTPSALYGTSGTFSFEVTGATTHSLPVTDALLDYRITNGKLRLRGETAIDPAWLGINPGETQSMSVGEPVGMVDPMTVLSVLSVIWGLLNPSADVTLPGAISATGQMQGDSLLVTFQDAPSIRLVMLFTFQLRVDSVSISTERVTVRFSGSRWIRERTFDVR